MKISLEVCYTADQLLFIHEITQPFFLNDFQEESCRKEIGSLEEVEVFEKLYNTTHGMPKVDGGRSSVTVAQRRFVIISLELIQTR